MLTNLDWLKPGETFPPKSDAARLKMYAQNRQLFEADHAAVYKDDLERIERVIGNFEKVVSYPVIVNFQKLLSLKVADLLLGEPPEIGAGDKGEAQQAAVDAIMDNSDLINTAYMAALDVSRNGDGLFLVRQGDGHGVIDITQPCIWFPVVDESNIRSVTWHVLAWVTGPDDALKLRVQVHGRGTVQTRVYKADKATGGHLIGAMESSVDASTGLSGFAVVQVPNVITSDRITGIDDYTDIDSIIAELMVRIGQVSRILDKHASPSMYGPKSVLEKDVVTGEWRFKAGNFYPLEDKDDVPPGYVTWDGQLASNFTHIEKLINFLYTISEMGATLFGDLNTQGGQIASGSALRRLMVSPLAKVARIRSRFDPALKQAIALCSELGGEGIVRLTPKDISIVWQDGLPGDPVEDSTIITQRTANKATMSQKRALMQFDGMTEADADEELALIADEEAASAPLTTIPPFGGGRPSAPASDNSPLDGGSPADGATSDEVGA